MPFLFGILFSKCHKMAKSEESQRPRETSFACLITQERSEGYY